MTLYIYDEYVLGIDYHELGMRKFRQNGAAKCLNTNQTDGFPPRPMFDVGIFAGLSGTDWNRSDSNYFRYWRILLLFCHV